MDVKDEIDALHGVTQAQTALIVALVTVMREKGLLSRVEVNIALDAALTAAELGPEISVEASRRARRILEVIAGELQGPTGG